MPDYRIYLLKSTGRIMGGSNSECVDDQAALELARSMLSSDAEAEIWTGVRSLGRVQAIKNRYREIFEAASSKNTEL